MTEFQYPELDEQLFREVLPNGLTVSVIRRRGFARSIAYFVTNYGSIHNRFRMVHSFFVYNKSGEWLRRRKREKELENLY